MTKGNISENLIKKPFIPRDWPKSRAIGYLSIIIELIIISPLYFFIGHLPILGSVLYVLFFLLWAVGFFSILFFMIRQFEGKYKKIVACDWSNQVW